MEKAAVCDQEYDEGESTKSITSAVQRSFSVESSQETCRLCDALGLLSLCLMLSQNNISLLIAKIRQTVGHFNHSYTAGKKLKNTEVTLSSSDSLQKVLATYADVKTR